MIYKILEAEEWHLAQLAGAYAGSAVDRRDGYIHFSTAAQMGETAARHFAGREGLLLLSVDERRLGEDLKWESSRGGDLFPHLYALLNVEMVQRVDRLPWDGSKHLFPEGLP